MAELYKTYRPKTLDQVVGQDAAISSLRTMIDKKRVPHALLFAGPSGCGKTTLARIVAKELGCHESQYTEVDSGQFRGVDTAREVREQMMYAPTQGKVRVWMLDECFPAGTKVATDSGYRSIESLQVGDRLTNVAGLGKVTATFTKQIPLGRVMRVKTTDGRIIFCSDGHEFLTNSGWTRALYLSKNDFLLSLGCSDWRESFNQNAGTQPDDVARSCREGANHQGDQGNAPSMERGTRREREINNGTDVAFGCTPMADRSCYSNRSGSHRNIPDVLQGGCGESHVQDSCGNRRIWTSEEKEYVAGCQKAESPRIIGVESVAVYQSGYNDADFRSVIGDSERDSGFVVMYDISVDTHPSYIVNGVMVHNCHNQTAAQQEAMLKALEDTPAHVYFMLATTAPDKLIKAIRTRCTLVEVVDLQPMDIAKKVLWPVCMAENRTAFPKGPLKFIGGNCGSSARTALVQLDAIWDLPDEVAMMSALKSMTVDEEKVVKLAKLLLNGASWSVVGAALKDVTGEPESIRYGLLGYAAAGATGWLMNNPAGLKRCGAILCACEKNWYDSKRNGLVIACMQVCGVL